MRLVLDYGDALGQFGDNAGLSTSGGDPNQDFLSTIGTILNSALGLLGVILLLLTLYAGFLWMTAQGNEEQVTKAKGLMKNAVIGLLIVLSAYSIANFVIYWTYGTWDFYGDMSNPWGN